MGSRRRSITITPVSEQPDTQVLVWRYGARKGAELPPEAATQLRLAHELREELVAIAHRREERVAEAWAGYPEVAAAQEAVVRSERALDELLKRASEERRRLRSRAVSPELRDEIKTAREARREARAGAREIKQQTYALATPALYAARRMEREERQATYAEFVQRRGLYHGTYNDIWRWHAVADRNVSRERKQGRSARLRHHGYDGTGRVAVYLQRRRGQPKRTAELLCSEASPWWGLLRLPDVCAVDPEEWAKMTRSEQRAAGRTEIAVRIGSGPRRSPLMWTIPIQVHRPLPSDCEVLAAQVVVRRVADTRRISVSLTCRVPAPASSQGPPVAVDIGWRSMPDGSIRVAYWRGASEPLQPLSVPEHLAEVLLVDRSGVEGEIRFPASWRAVADRLDKIRSRRDKDLSRITTQVASWLEAHQDAATELEVAPAEIVRWRSHARMAAFARQFAEQRPADEVIREMLSWERRDRHLWQWEAHERDQLVGRRRDAYRAIAAVLARAWPHLILGQRFVAQVARRPAQEEADTQRAEGARAQAQLAAPAELAEALKRAMLQQGGRTVEMDEGRGRDRHHLCGAELPRDVDAARDATVVCPGCGATVDRSQNAVLNMLQAARGDAGETDGSARTLALDPPTPARRL